MPTPFPAQPYDIQFARLAVTVIDMLARDMDETFCDLIHRAGTDPHSPHKETAEAAERIVAACARLLEAIRRYQCCDTLRRIQDQEQQQEPWMQYVPF